MSRKSHPSEKREKPQKPDDRPDAEDVPEDDKHTGAKEDQVGNRTGPGAGYDTEPEPVEDTGGVSES